MDECIIKTETVCQLFPDLDSGFSYRTMLKKREKNQIEHHWRYAPFPSTRANYFRTKQKLRCVGGSYSVSEA